MKKFKFSVTTNEEWGYHYEIEAKDSEEAKAKIEQEVISPQICRRRDRIITSMVETKMAEGRNENIGGRLIDLVTDGRLLKEE